jgi:glyoxylase-like metal-dependent hydrolase (beta-lactamase superfamily II)
MGQLLRSDRRSRVSHTDLGPVEAMRVSVRVVPVTPLRLTEVAPNVHRLATTYWNWPEFVAALTKLGHSPADVDAVLVTHHHPDHAGNAERLRSGGARVLAHPADAPYLRGEKRMSNLGVVKYLWHPWFVFYMLRQLAKGVTRTPAIAKLDELRDGEVLDVPGRPRVIHAPGHTAGSCALFLEERSLLFTGDALVTLDMTRGRTGPQIIRGAWTEDADLALESLDQLAATKAGTVLPGHGELWTEGVESAVKQARGAASKVAGRASAG